MGSVRCGGLAVNTDGTVIVGDAKTPEGVAHAVRWDTAGKITDLDPGGQYRSAVGVNNSGTVIATVYDPGVGPEYVVRWDADGTPIRLEPLPGDTYVMAQAINRFDVVIGNAATAAGWSRAVRWDRSGRATELSPLPGHLYSSAAGR
ncbi:hypothetical protein [Actinokineospora xionganensis]|uniref:YD repeat-containing protein n=1 Tax=Actinokineospora xionganensis TaxID=2684470 RepID=A0ABR7LDW0_9PSEU|nr:hypothetical protein [Actinokineospora xionganensis]MBC6450864.1 hypothetical protein [Actinokineospora xionganensis]